MLGVDPVSDQVVLCCAQSVQSIALIAEDAPRIVERHERTSGRRGAGVSTKNRAPAYRRSRRAVKARLLALRSSSESRGRGVGKRQRSRKYPVPTPTSKWLLDTCALYHASVWAVGHRQIRRFEMPSTMMSYVDRRPRL